MLSNKTLRGDNYYAKNESVSISDIITAEERDIYSKFMTSWDWSKWAVEKTYQTCVVMFYLVKGLILKNHDDIVDGLNAADDFHNLSDWVSPMTLRFIMRMKDLLLGDFTFG